MQPNLFFFYFLSISALLLVHSQPCPSGETEVTTKTRSTTCNKCSPGRYIPKGGLTCKECPLGYYQSLHGQSRCDIKSCQATQFKNSNRSKTGSVVGTSLEKTFIACNAGYSGGGEIMCQSTVGNTLQHFTRVTCERNDYNVRRITNEIKTPSRSPSPLSNATIMETKSRTELSKEAVYGLISGGVGLFVIAGIIFFVVHHHNEIKHKKHVKRVSASREALGTGTKVTPVGRVSSLRPSRSGWGGTRLSKEALELFDDDGTQLPHDMLARTKSGKFDL